MMNSSLSDIPLVPPPTKEPAVEEGRTIYVNDAESNLPFKYAHNKVTTAKYTFITFFPKNLFEQFCRLANIYFIIISALQLIPGVSPTGRWNTLGPLLFVMSVTAVKEAYEDIKRHRQDTQVNNHVTEVLRGGRFERVAWKEVQTGDIVKLTNRQLIPADLVVLTSSEPQGMCYIETANLDGETNLKIRQSLDETYHMQTPEALQAFKGVIKCEHPNNRLYNFDGTINFNNQSYPLGVKQILLRGAMLRNTKWVYGIAIFTGADTKLVRNSRATPAKRSNVERVTNRQVLLIFAFQIFICSFCAVAARIWLNKHHDTTWYLQWQRKPADEAGWAWITFLILYNNLIPISLYVTVEVVKLIQAYFINSDIEMYYARNDTPALARTSNLNEELGQVEYIFSDKTGTLTQNLMEFRKCSIAGIAYGGLVNEDLGASTESAGEPAAKMEEKKEGFENVNFNDPRLLQNLRSGHPTAEVAREFLTLLAVCHTVIPEHDDDGKLIYQASSPDEAALVSAARFFGFEYSGKTTKTVTVTVQGKQLTYEVLNVLEFNSTRKRMSVIVRTPEGKILLYCKGADTVIYERLGPDQPYGNITITHLQEFASEGLRTLCVAVSELDPAQYEEWNKIFRAASLALVNREQELDKAAELVEKNLFLLGATAIEDKLQDGVPETIQLLGVAGIKIWVLTGDKQETAINIGYACQLLNDRMELMVINEDSAQATKREIEKRLNAIRMGKSPTASPTSSPGPSPSTTMGEGSSGELALIIDGHTLHYALEDDVKLLLLELATMCKAVVCCRVSPLQKALVVTLVRENLSAISLAIGDGANDVSMIQAAHVGIGISGEEGLQAARASDYSIAQFRFLQRLLLIHGRHSYRRISKVILYSFYKNIALYIVQFWFTIHNAWSGQTFFERTTLTAYNIAWTLLPVVAVGVFDKDVNDRLLLEHPQLYQTGIRRYYYNYRVFWGWVVNALYHSFICYWFVELTFLNQQPYHDGRMMDLFSMGSVSFTCVVVVVTLKLSLETRYWTWVNHFVVWGSIIVYAMWLMVYGVFYDGTSMGADLYRTVFQLYRAPEYYLVIVFVVVLCLWRDVTWKFFARTHLPQSYHIVQELQAMDKRSRKTDRASARKIYTGYSFSQDSSEADNARHYNTMANV
eukprot:Phypoly_transcript_00973.p1 GENE.Phypoly_transcript_00973~~Phypoly_transcript_00973.p1  ORF type:complete len:1149 (+),score=209.12 Phypoly_transcript_00973:246-3692(+)